MNNLNVNSIFETDTWLDVVANDNWERIEIKKKNGDIEAAFPIVKGKNMGFKCLNMPALTQTLGIYFSPSNAKMTKKLEREKKLVNRIIEELPKGYNFDFSLDIDNKYILPFIWAGCRISPRYSYRLEKLDNLDEIWAGFKENIKTDIRKAEKRVIVRDDLSIDVLIEMQEKTFERQNRKMPYNKDMIKELDKVMLENDARKLFCAVDEEGNKHSATYFVYDDNRCYYLMSGGDPEYRNSGATSLLVWEGIKFANQHSRIFDFEGSMIESIERFVRGFGAVPRVYYHVTKKNAFLSFADYMKPKIKKMIGYK